MQETEAGPKGGEKGVAGKKGAKRPEHLANRVKRKAPNGGFGQGIGVAVGFIGKLLNAKNTYLSALSRNFVGKFMQRHLFGPPSRSGVFENQDAAIAKRDLGRFPCLQRRKT